MFYLKIKDEKVIEAPKTCIRKGYQVFGYNKNEKMLLEDGYKAFDFPASLAEVKEGEIVKKEIAPPEKTVFSKLAIRRACRELGIENKLNALLEASADFKNDWSDAQHIDLTDEILLEALKAGKFTDKEIKAIKELLK